MKKALVVYYSLSGNTRGVARKIASRLHADILEIYTEKDYPDDYDVLLGLGKRETASGYLPKLKPYRVDYTKYDTIVVGTPVWWGTIAPAMRSFLSSNLAQLKGKNVYPFATNGNWLGRTPSDFKKALRGVELGQLLNVRFEDKTQVTPNMGLTDWVKEIAK